jgi:hypothetical protein
MNVVTLTVACCLAFVTASHLHGQILGDVVHGDFLDQKFEEDFSDPRYKNQSAYAPVNEYQEYAQSFTVGHDGLLSHVEIYGSEFGYTGLTVTVYNAVGGQLGAVLGSRTVMGQTSTTLWWAFDLRSAGIFAHQGDRLAIAVSGNFSWIANLWGDPLRTYEGGYVYNRLIQDSGGEHTIPVGQWYGLDEPYYARNDLMFHTFVIPEPSTILLATIAFAVLPTCRRKSVPHNRV